MKPSYRVTNCAIDGDVIEAVVTRQIGSIPKDTTTLILSVGGNDGLRQLSVLISRGFTPIRLWNAFQWIWSDFRDEYEEMIKELVAQEKELIVLTIYYPQLGFWGQQTISKLGVYFLDSIIVSSIDFFVLRLISSVCRKYKLPVIDLRVVFNRMEDYANPIEPGVPGGDKIVNNILHILENHSFGEHKVYTLDSYSDGIQLEEFRKRYWGEFASNPNRRDANEQFREKRGRKNQIVLKATLGFVFLGMVWWYFFTK